MDAPGAAAPSKLGELRSTIARLQQRIDEAGPAVQRLEDMRERVDTAIEILDEVLELLDRPEGVANRRRIRLKIEEARKVLE